MIARVSQWLLLPLVAGLAPIGRVCAQDHLPLAFVGVHVVSMESDSILINRDVVAIDGRIAAIAPTGEVDIPPEAVRIDGAGAFLMPGLIDLHVHPTDEHDFPLYLANGVTTVQMLNAFPTALEWRNAIDSGQLVGPMIHPCAGPVSGIVDPDEARRRVSDLEAEGFECIKIYDELSAEAYVAIVEAARERGLRTVSHIPRNLDWQDMLQAHPDAVAHAEEFLYSPIDSADDVARIIDRMSADSIALITTLWNYDLIGRQPVLLDKLLERPELRYYSPVDRRGWERGRNQYLETPLDKVSNRRRLLRFQRSLVERLHVSGGTVLLGTDAGNNFVLPGWSAHAELAQLVQSGLTPYQALAAATRDAARFLGDDAGTVTVGRRADLVLVVGNPLAEIANAGLILGVAVRGRWLPRASLRLDLEEQAAEFAFEAEFLRDVETSGLEIALEELRRSNSLDGPMLRPRVLNELGYQLWYLEDRPGDAVRAFDANVELHPDWEPAHRSLAEACAAATALSAPARACTPPASAPCAP